MGRKVKDKTGQYFGRLLVLERAENSKCNRIRWLCVCDCDNYVIVHSSKLNHRNRLSCGCHKPRHSGTKLYRIWDAFKSRCYNPNVKDYRIYGGRGITVCDEWRCNFLTFREWAWKNGYKEGLQIDRIDNDKGYSPSNCRFVTRKEQMRNRRNNVYFEDKLLVEIAETTDIPYYTLYLRLKHNPDITHSQLVRPSSRKCKT